MIESNQTKYEKTSTIADFNNIKSTIKTLIKNATEAYNNMYQYLESLYKLTPNDKIKAEISFTLHGLNEANNEVVHLKQIDEYLK